MYFDALSATAFIPDAEMTFAAVPYYAPVRNANDPLLDYSWSVGGASIPEDAKTKSEITINAKDSTGIALVDLSITHRTNFFFEAKGTWNVTFSSFAGSTNDSFHTTQ